MSGFHMGWKPCSGPHLNSEPATCAQCNLDLATLKLLQDLTCVAQQGCRHAIAGSHFACENDGIL